jgi:hypothetical protein
MTSNHHPDYTPLSSAAMLAKQDERDALRLLIAQRRLYRRAKRWLGLRWFGMLVIGLAAPVVAVIEPDFAVWVGGVAGLWLFVGRTALVFVQSATTARAAATQEQFDFYVYGMPSSIDRTTLPPLEEIAKIAGADDQLKVIATEEKLIKWYPIKAADSGIVSVAISQRANASYADRLLRTTAITWGVVTAVWAVALIVASVIAALPLLTFIAGVLLPLLPAFLDIVQYVVGIWRAARDRGDLARSIEEKLRGIGSAIEPSDLLVWQERLYGLRTCTPEVPDFIYKLQRKANERAMHSAARQLADKAKRSGQ